MKASSQNSDGMEFRKDLWLLYLLFIGVEIALKYLWPVFNANLQRTCQIGIELPHVLEPLYKQVSVGSIYPFGF